MNLLSLKKVSIKKRSLNCSIHHEKNVNKYLKGIKKSGSLSTEQYKKIKPVRGRPVIFYRLCKVHEAITNVYSTFKPILSTVWNSYLQNF